MKRILCVILIILTAACLFSCTDGKGEDTVKISTCDTEAIKPKPTLVIIANGKTFYAGLEDNQSAKEFTEKLSPGEITVNMSDCGGFEKSGELPWTVQTSDENITAKPGDIILYQGNKISVCCGENTYGLTKLASIGNTSKEELLSVLGEGDVTVKFYLEYSE